MKEVVRKEILKLLEAGIIYPVADSRWVSPVHCVPKKGGITVVPNDNDFSVCGSSFDDCLSNLDRLCRDVKKLTLS